MEILVYYYFPLYIRTNWYEALDIPYGIIMRQLRLINRIDDALS